MLINLKFANSSQTLSFIAEFSREREERDIARYINSQLELGCFISANFITGVQVSRSSRVKMKRADVVEKNRSVDKKRKRFAVCNFLFTLRSVGLTFIA